MQNTVLLDLARVYPLHTDGQTDDNDAKDAVQHNCCATKTTKPGFEL